MDAVIRVALLGQNSIVREGLGRILSVEHFEVTQSVSDESRLSDDGTPDDLLILIDGELETGSGTAVRALHARFPAVKLVVLSEVFDFDLMTDAFNAGADGYIIKEIASEPLIGSLRLVALGEKVMPSRLADALSLHGSSEERDSGRRLLAGAHLSVREGEILACLIIGSSNKVISRRLTISEATVKVHVKAILRKLHVKNRTQAAIHGINGGMDSRQTDLPFAAEISTIIDGKPDAILTIPV